MKLEKSEGGYGAPRASSAGIAETHKHAQNAISSYKETINKNI